jgi:hypothetical protein
MGTSWLANLALINHLSLQNLRQDTFLQDYWQENFAPFPPWSDWGWFRTMLSGLVQNQLGIQSWTGIALILIVLGWLFLYRKNEIFAVIISAIYIFSLAVASMEIYPLGGRLSLYLVPVMTLLLAQSSTSIEDFMRNRFPQGGWFAVLISIFLLYAPFTESINRFLYPKYFEHIRPSMATLSQAWEPGDAMFISNGAEPAFLFYAERYGLGEVPYRTGMVSDYSEPAKIQSYLQALDGNPRVWILVTHVFETDDFNEKDYLLSSLDELGKLKREFRSPGTSVYLYLFDLGR